MAKVTLVIEDTVVDGKKAFKVSGDFDEPGKSYEEMTANPTRAVAFGLRMIAIMCEESASFKGEMVDEFGTTMEYQKP